MKIIISCVGLLLLVTVAGRAETVPPDPDDWYQNQYAPLWKENTWDKVEQAATYYDETVYLHPPDGSLTAVSGLDWLTTAIAGWKADGWLGSAVVGYRSDRLNSSTIAFYTKWHDWYAEGHEDYSCGWYLADLKDNVWVFTQYAEIDCTERDL